MRRIGRRLWMTQESGLSINEQAALWRAAARGARANGDREAAERYTRTARLIESTRPAGG